MMKYIFILFLGMAGPVSAQMSMDYLIGHWSGRGSITTGDAPPEALRCRLSISPDLELVQINLRCGTTSGTRTTTFALQRLDNGDIITVPDSRSADNEMKNTVLGGRFSEESLVLSDGSNIEGVVVAFWKLNDGRLRFSTVAFPNKVRTQAVVDLSVRPAN